MNKKQRNARQRKRYYKKEYERLLSQAKKLYNEMHLGATFGADLPSFEKILNYAGTKSDLKNPTMKSIKALRKLQGEEGILWGVEHTLPKKKKKAIEKSRELTSKYRESEKAIKKAKQTIKTYINETYIDVDSKTRNEITGDIMNSIDTLLAELRYYKNYCDTEYNREQNKKRRKTTENQRMIRLGYAEGIIDELISEIKSILNSGDKEKIIQLGKNCDGFFLDHPGGIDIKEFYKGASDVRYSVLKDIDKVKQVEPKQEQKPSLDVDDVSDIMPDAYFITDDFF